MLRIILSPSSLVKCSITLNETTVSNWPGLEYRSSPRASPKINSAWRLLLRTLPGGARNRQDQVEFWGPSPFKVKMNCRA